MFGNKKLPVITDTYGAAIRIILKIASVLTGVEAQFKRFDFNTGRGQVWLGSSVQDFYLDAIDGFDGNRFHFATIATDQPSPETEDYGWYYAHLEEDGSVRIAAEFERNAHRRADGMPMWWVGNSASNRREVPYWP